MDTTNRLLGGKLSRRAFLAKLALVTDGTSVALACGSSAKEIAPTRRSIPATSTTAGSAVSGGDSSATHPSAPDSIEAGPMEFEGNGAKLLGYLSRPTLPGHHPGIVVVHENRGLLPHFEDVTRRFAREGYVALAVDMLSR